MFHYLQFWLKSTNQHGVHSPFVYNYLTRGIYQSLPDIKQHGKTLQWLEKTIRYFTPEAIYVLDKETENIVGEYREKLTDNFNAAEMIIGRQTPENQTVILNRAIRMAPQQLLLFYNGSYDAAFQQQLRHNENITLVIDFYYGTLLSRRTEQLKENFFLRL